jgi:tetratricopeptide (TPR) repeat protein
LSADSTDLTDLTDSTVVTVSTNLTVLSFVTVVNVLIVLTVFTACGNALANDLHASAHSAAGGKKNKPVAAVENSSSPPANANPQAARWIQKGLAEAKDEHYDAALLDLNRGLALDPRLGNVDVFEARLGAYMSKHQWKEALAETSRLIELRPTNGFFYNSRGQIYVLLNQNDLAIKDFLKAQPLIPGHKWLYLELGHCYDRAGQFDKSVAVYSKALALDPQFVKAIVYRANAYEKLGKKDLAAKDRDAASSLSGGWASDLLQPESKPIK